MKESAEVVQPTSEALMARARRVMPGGVSSPVRSFRSVGGRPFVARRGEGAYILDVDGRRFIDLVGSWGALIHGHNHPRILEAIERAARDGTSFGITCENEIELCELMTECIPALEMVRLVNSGTEACMSAIRLARGATKREKIIKFDGHYHGHADSFLVAAGSGAATLGVSGSEGVTSQCLKDTIVLPFNDRSALKVAFEKLGSEIAGVILEVVSGNMGVVPATIDWLQDLRSWTEKTQSLLIFDEVMTGFRLSLSGAQGLYGIRPDLMCLGKIIGGGLPVGAYGGTKILMEKVAPLGSVYQAGTLSGNPLATAAGLESLRILREEGPLFYQRLDAAASEWKSQLDSHISLKGYEAKVVQRGSMLSIFFRKEAPLNYEEVKTQNIERFNRFFWSLMRQNVYFPPSAFEASFLSSAHSDSIMDEVMTKSHRALDEVFQ